MNKKTQNALPSLPVTLAIITGYGHKIYNYLDENGSVKEGYRVLARPVRWEPATSDLEGVRFVLQKQKTPLKRWLPSWHTWEFVDSYGLDQHELSNLIADRGMDGMFNQVCEEFRKQKADRIKNNLWLQAWKD